MYSAALRRILKEQYEVDVGLYSYGQCLQPGFLPPGTTVGRYCSLGPEMVVFRRNHPPDRISLHPFFFNRHAGLVTQDTVEDNKDNPLEIGHDVWIGARAIILPRCRRIGNGAVIGAGAVVTRDVPDFAIVAGNPARVVRDRFSAEWKSMIARSEWWLQPVEVLADHLAVFAVPVEKIERQDLPILRGNGSGSTTSS